MTRRFPDTCDWSTNPAMTVRRLVLPLPLGPISAETVPGRKDVVQPWMTRFGARLPLASRTMGAYRRSTRSTRTRLRGARAVAASSSDAVDADGRIVGATGRVGTRERLCERNEHVADRVSCGRFEFDVKPETVAYVTVGKTSSIQHT